jgi:Fic family protein
MSFEFDDFDVRNLFSELDDRIDELRQLLLDCPGEIADFEERCKIAYIYHDSALEGIVLTYHELHAAIDRKITSDSSMISTYQEIKNHSDALDLVRARVDVSVAGMIPKRKKNVEISRTIFDDLHRVLYRNLPRKYPGVLRKEIPIHRTYFHDISSPETIETGLESVAALVSDGEFKGQHPINQAALFHHAFMQVFPYTEGSGKVGRLLMNKFLWRAGYLPAVIHASDRQAYYEALQVGPEALRLILVEAIDQAVDTGIRHLKERVKARAASRSKARFG